MTQLKVKMTLIRQIRLFLSAVGFLALLPFAVHASLIRDTEIERGLEQLALPLARDAGLPTVTIRLVPDDSYNAFIVGGTTIYVHTGLLKKALSTSEIIGVLAHEIGHLAAGHAPRRAEAIQDANLTTTLATFAAAAIAASGASSDAALGIALGGADRANRNYQSLSRMDESVADEWALRLLQKQQISAAGLSDFMRRIAAQRALPESRQSDYYQSHPGAGARLLAFEDHVRQFGTQSPGISPEDEALMQKLIGKLRAYTDPPPQTLADIARQEAASKADAGTKKWPVFDQEVQRYRTAIAHYRRGALDKAEMTLAPLLERYQDNVFLHEFHGDILLSAGKLDEAIDAYHSAIGDQQFPLIEFALGKAYLARADMGHTPSYEQAATAFAKAARHERRWPGLQRQLAIALGRSGQLAQADLALANEALLLGDKGRAIQMAKRALERADISKETRNKANDIVFSLQGAK